MHLQPRVFLVYFTVILCTLSLPLNSARNLESSKNDLVRENGISEQNFGSGKFNTQCNTASAAECYKTKRNLHSMLLIPKDYQQKLHPKIPLNADLMEILWEYEDDDRSKRFDDYGHMRFGKRGGEQFDDYGHMRFGRSI